MPSTRALTFVVLDLASRRPIGHALICPAVRYASIAWGRPLRLDRRPGDPFLWNRLEGRLRQQAVKPGPIDRDSPMLRLLVPPERRHRVVLQYVADAALELGTIGAAGRLDAQLRKMAATVRT